VKLLAAQQFNNLISYLIIPACCVYSGEFGRRGALAEKVEDPKLR